MVNESQPVNVEQRRIQCWDVDAGYAAAHRRYRISDLAAVGFQEVDIDGFHYASDLSRRLDGTSYIPADHLRAAPATSLPLYTLFRMVLDGGVTNILNRYFQSEFAPCFCSMLKMGPLVEDEIDDSYRWHVDNGPSSHLKLIVYLNDDHDGATAVMSCQDSRKFIDAGYLEQERLFRLDEFAEQHGISYTPYKTQPKAGSGLIFEPTNVLHKGMYPTFGERRVFQIGIIPWGQPWESFYEEHWAKGDTNSNGFPRYEAGDRSKVA